MAQLGILSRWLPHGISTINKNRLQVIFDWLYYRSGRSQPTTGSDLVAPTRLGLLDNRKPD